MDPLKPFDSLLQTLRTARAARTTRRHSSQPSLQTSAIEAAARPPDALRERLRPRLLALQQAPAHQRREAFVEVVLLSRLSEAAATDPRLGDIVRSVAAELGDHPQFGARLEELLQGLQQEHDAAAR